MIEAYDIRELYPRARWAQHPTGCLCLTTPTPRTKFNYMEIKAGSVNTLHKWDRRGLIHDGHMKRFKLLPTFGIKVRRLVFVGFGIK